MIHFDAKHQKSEAKTKVKQANGLNKKVLIKGTVSRNLGFFEGRNIFICTF
jgi:hypothetical protein